MATHIDRHKLTVSGEFDKRVADLDRPSNLSLGDEPETLISQLGTVAIKPGNSIMMKPPESLVQLP